MNANHDDIVRLISIVLAGDASEEEFAILQQWIDLSPENKVYYQQLKNIWENSSHKSDFARISTDKALDKVLYRILPHHKLSVWAYWQKIAAILLIPLLLGNLFWFFLSKEGKLNLGKSVSYNEIYAAYGTRSSIKLADGSQVWLNSGSSLRYPDKFINNKRVVYLKGEAYFEVHSDKSRPFIVQSHSVSVTATGTAFNVNAFANSKEIEVTLVQGKVSVNQAGSDNLISELKPNQHLVFDTASLQSSLQTVDDVYKYISWKDGKLIFRNEPMVSVVRKINQIYNVDIKLKGENLQGYRYRATFENETLSDILKMLKLTAPIDYKESERVMKEDGSFTPKQIIIYEKRNTK
jgi:transmembrane sensor